MTICRELLVSTVKTFVVAILTVFLQPFAHAQTSSPPPPLILGVAWYPEAWPETRWETDLELMQKAGIHVVRVGEGAWSMMEPSAGQYNFGWLQRGRAGRQAWDLYRDGNPNLCAACMAHPEVS